MYHLWLNLGNILAVPPKYATTGVIGDLGILVSNEDNNETYVARSTSCTLMKSNNRPIWGVVIFNNRNLGYGQIQFQKVVSVAVTNWSMLRCMSWHMS